MKLNTILKSFLVLALMGITLNGFSQINNWRAYDQSGVDVFEPVKDKDATFDGVKVRVGGSFTQQYSNLSHSHSVLDTNGNVMADYTDDLYNLGAGFPLANANLNIDVQLAPGIRLNLQNYMSSLHHTEFWVKGGYIQVDQLPMLGDPAWFKDKMRVKVGHFEPNYGDAMFRRSDNGNAMYNPFVGNYIMDAFTTEIGGELYYWVTPDVMLMGGLTTGLINGDLTTRVNGREKAPALYLKAAWDKQMNEDLRVRVAASFSNNSNSGRSTLYGGDRCGTRFQGAMEEVDASLGGRGDFTSGRWNPGFTNKYMATQLNAFVKFQGIEFFGTYEMTSGNNLQATGEVNEDGPVFDFADSTSRTVNQMAVDLVYRFLKNESAYVALRYNTVGGELGSGYVDGDASEFSYLTPSIDRLQFSAGWFATPNLLLKLNYVNQNYKDFPNTDYFFEGNFNGIVIEAVAAF